MTATTDHPTARELSLMATISSGWTDDLKIDTGTRRVWLSRLTTEDGDGAPYDNTVTVEEYDAETGRWETVEEYDGGPVAELHPHGCTVCGNTDLPTIGHADECPGPDVTAPITGTLLGRRATVRGGFESGATGVIVANEPDRTRANPYGTDRPYRYRLWLDGASDHPGPQTIGGLHPVDLDLEPCPYCGPGPCSGTARTAGGRDLERFERIHQPGRDAVHAWRAAGAPR